MQNIEYEVGLEGKIRGVSQGECAVSVTGGVFLLAIYSLLFIAVRKNND